MATTLPARGLLFDNDGVLVDSDASVLLSWSRWARQYGLDPDSVVDAVHGRRSSDTVALLVADAERERALADIDAYEVEDAGTVTALPGADRLLRSLPPSTWAVVTSGRRDLATARLVAAGLPSPQVLVPAEDVAAGKPDPSGYLRGAQLLELAAEQCVVLEDSPAGVAAGLAAGAAVVGVGERALATDAPVVVRDLRGLRFDGAGLYLPEKGLLRAP